MYKEEKFTLVNFTRQTSWVIHRYNVDFGVKSGYECIRRTIISPLHKVSPTTDREVEMSFIMEFVEDLIMRMMEDPKERDRKFRGHVYAVKEHCAKTKEMWALPICPYGFWTFERHNSQLAWDAQIIQVEGRRDPYDELLEDRSKK